MSKKFRFLSFLVGIWLLVYGVIVGEAVESLLIPGNDVATLNFLSPLEKEVVVELNIARTNPARYAQYVEEFKSHYAGRYIYLAGQTQIVTQEGVAAVNEAIEFLKNCEPLPLLRVSQGLSLAARDHVRNQGPSGNTGHQGEDRSSIAERINRYGSWGVAYAENIEYGNFTARQIVMQLIIDDGVPNRSHRLNMFKPVYTLMGVSCGDHNSYGQMCVIDFAGSYQENSAK